MLLAPPAWQKVSIIVGRRLNLSHFICSNPRQRGGGGEGRGGDGREEEVRENNAISGSALFNLLQVDGGSPIASPRLISNPHALSITVHLPLGLWNGGPNCLARSTLMENTLSPSLSSSPSTAVHFFFSSSSPLFRPRSCVSLTKVHSPAAAQTNWVRKVSKPTSAHRSLVMFLH